MPITPFIGVRISWLIVARNSDFARFAASAAASFCLSALMSRTIVSSPIGRPASLRNGVATTETSTSSPPLVLAHVSNDAGIPRSTMAPAASTCAPRPPHRSSSRRGRPITSAAL